MLFVSLIPSIFGVKSEYRCGHSYEDMGTRSFSILITLIVSSAITTSPTTVFSPINGHCKR